MTRAEWCELACARLSAAIARETPPGLGAWARAWDIVEEASGAFLRALAAAERGEGSPDEVSAAGLAVLAAWRDARKEWMRRQE